MFRSCPTLTIRKRLSKSRVIGKFPAPGGPARARELKLLKTPFRTSYSVLMPLSKIEELLFSASGNSAQLLTHFRLADGQINLLLEPVSDRQRAPGKVVQATFAKAVIESIEEDESERNSWPLDIIGFDCSNEVSAGGSF
jgi:hypothetical protein